MKLYIDPGTGSMLFTILIGIIGAAVYSLRMLLIKFRFRLSGGKQEVGTAKLPFVIFSDDKRYWNVFEPICRELGMPQMAFDILMFLSNNPEHCTAKEISRFRGFKENIISVNVNKLVSEGYLLRENDQLDRRKVRLSCTEKAAAIVRRGREIQDRFFQQIQQGLTQAELNTHFHCLETIAANAQMLLEQKNEG